MGRIRHIIRREYVERVRKKGFWIGTLLLPVFMVLITLAPILLSTLSPERQKKIAVLDYTGSLFEPLKAALAGDKRLRLKSGLEEYQLEQVPVVSGSVRTDAASVKERIRRDELYGALVIGDKPDESGNFTFYGRNVSNVDVLKTLQTKLLEGVIWIRLEKEQINATRDQLDRVMADIELDTIQVMGSGEERKSMFVANWLGTFVFVMVLYMSFLMYGTSIIRGILEEKTSRIIEVLLSTFKPFELLMGKILGLGLVGVTQVAVYALGFLAVTVIGGMGAAAMDPKLLEMVSIISPSFVIYFALFFFLGYFLFATMFATVGSLCNTEQEAQSMQLPLVVALIIPMVSTIFLVQHPDALITRVLSLIPFFTPMVMFMRISNMAPPFWEIALSVILLLASIAGITWIAARVFRVAILMYGKKPTVREIYRWMRAG